MLQKILYCSLKIFDTISKSAQGFIAKTAQKAAHFSSVMVMIYGQWLNGIIKSTYSANAVLRFQHGVVVGKAQAVAAPKSIRSIKGLFVRMFYRATASCFYGLIFQVALSVALLTPSLKQMRLSGRIEPSKFSERFFSSTSGACFLWYALVSHSGLVSFKFRSSWLGLCDVSPSFKPFPFYHKTAVIITV